MPERNLDFDEVISRRGTGSLKYDFARQRGKPEGVLPLWVADMDFRTSSFVQDALDRTVRHGIWGYSEPDQEYFSALASWMKRRHGWCIREEWIIRTPGVVFALAMAIRAFTEPGDAVMIQQPVYYPFSEVIRDNGRRVVSSNLVFDEAQGRYRMDLEDFERKLKAEKAGLFILCSPHNPVGRVWTEEELAAVGEICRRNGVIVVSDEIHHDFVFSGKHTVFPLAGKGFDAFSVVCTSPSKTFNLAGLQLSNIITPDETLRSRLKKQLDAAGYSQANLFGLKACEAAYSEGEDWLEALLLYLRGNMDWLTAFVRDRLPGIRVIRPEGTYLVWLDFKALGLTREEQEDLVVNRAGLWLDSGAVFGESGEGYERINIACPRATLEEAMLRLEKAVREMR